MKKDIAIFSGTANPELAKKIASRINAKLGRLLISRFPDNETYCRYEEEIRGKHVFIVQPTCNPGNENLMELLVAIDAAKHSGARSITAVVPYYGYARQDRQSKPGEPITAALVAKMLKIAGASSIITMDLHSKAVEKAITIKKIHLHALPVLADYFRKKKLKNLCVVAPDKGSVANARKQARLLKASVAWIDKKRLTAHKVLAQKIFGNVKDKNCVIIDDIISTASTICEASKFLKNAGAKNIYVVATHGVLAGKAIRRLSRAPIKEVIVTDTIPQARNRKRLRKLKVVSVAGLFAEAIEKMS